MFHEFAQRKDDEDLIMDNGDWNQQEELREDMEYEDIETRLIKKEENDNVNELEQMITHEVNEDNEIEHCMLSELPCSGMFTPRSTASNYFSPNTHRYTCSKYRQ